MIRLILPTIVLCCVLCVASTTQAASAVAVAINSKGGLGYGYYHDPNLSETEVRKRAMNECLNWGGRNARIVASTSQHGYGAVIWFLRADKRLDYSVALGAGTWEGAVNDAKRKAKSSGGTAFKLVREWNDALPKKGQPIIMQKL
jgi:hypothetical protein